jgi:DNA-binding phage protein
VPKKNWEKKYNEIKEQYPDVLTEDWNTLLRRDSDIFAKLLGDVLKFKGKKSVPGKRPNLTRDEAERRLLRMADEDFANAEFKEAFRALSANRSLRNIAAKTGLGKSYVHRLLNGEQSPSFGTMEEIAKAFNKHPSYFLEYRIAKVVVVVERFLSATPEAASGWYLKVVDKNDRI